MTLRSRLGKLESARPAQWPPTWGDVLTEAGVAVRWSDPIAHECSSDARRITYFFRPAEEWAEPVLAAGYDVDPEALRRAYSALRRRLAPDATENLLRLMRTPVATP